MKLVLETEYQSTGYLLWLSSRCYVTVGDEYLFLTVPWFLSAVHDCCIFWSYSLNFRMILRVCAGSSESQQFASEISINIL